MAGKATRILSTEWDIDRELRKFGATRDELLTIVDAVVGARGMAVLDDPSSASGLFAYIHGVRQLRRVFRQKGWEIERENNIEAVRDPATGMRIVYQNVDMAGVAATSPRALNGKRDGSRRQIDAAQGMLFTPSEIPEAYRLPPGAFPLIYYFCVSVDTTADDRQVGAELSMPRPFRGDNFSGFFERVLIRRHGPWDDQAGIVEPLPDDAVELAPTVSRKHS